MTGLSLSLAAIVVFLALAATILLVGGTVSACRVATHAVVRARERRSTGRRRARVATS